MSAEVFIGVDVSSSEIGIAMIPSGNTESISNDHRGLEALVLRLREVNPSVVVLAESNGKSIHVTGALAASSLPVVTIASRQIRDFATALGLGEDRVDASLLARFAQAARPSPKLLGDQKILDIDALVQRRFQLSAMHIEEHERLQSAVPLIRKNIERHIEWLTNKIADIDKALAKLWLGNETSDMTGESHDLGESGNISNSGALSDSSERPTKRKGLKFKKPKKGLAALGQALKQKRHSTGDSANLSRPDDVAQAAASGSASQIPIPSLAGAKKVKSNTVNFECAACGTKTRVNRGPDGKLIAKEIEGWKLMRDGETVLKFCPRCSDSAGSVFQ